jgi:hypothetical protein
MSTLKEVTRKTLISQTSDQLFKKLQDGKLFGVSKVVVIDILTERKEKGKFDGDLSVWATLKVKSTEKVSKEEKIEKKENVAKEPKEKKEKGPSAMAAKFPDFKLKFKKDQEVKFTPWREEKELTGVVISSYPWAPKSGEVREDVRIRVGDKVYIKKGTEVKTK